MVSSLRHSSVVAHYILGLQGSPDASKSAHPTNKRKRPQNEPSENNPIASSSMMSPESISHPVAKRVRRTSEKQPPPAALQHLRRRAVKPQDQKDNDIIQQRLENIMKTMDKLAELRLSILGSPDHKDHSNEWYRALLAPPQIALVNPCGYISKFDCGLQDPLLDEESDDDSATEVEDSDDIQETKRARMRKEKTKDAVPLEQVVFPCQHWVDEIGPRAGCPIVSSKILMTLRRGATSLVTLRMGDLGWNRFKYISKSRPLSKPELLRGLFVEVRKSI